MIDALTAAAQMLSDDTQRLNTISHNLANVSTTGYKRQRAVSAPFQDYLVAQAAGGPSALSITSPGHTIQTDTRPGMLQQTSNPLHVAIEDNSFFEIQTDRGLAYTRRGDFQLDAQGQLVTQKGYAVMGTAGTIRLNTTEPIIDQSGAVYEKDNQIAQLKLVRFSNAETLEQVESGLFIPSVQTQFESNGHSKIRQGHLEASNVVSMEEMVRLIETMRHFESAQKIVQGYDDMMEKALRKLGEF